MADLSANSAGSVSVAIGADLGPLQTALAKAEQIVRAFDARMSAASGGAGLLGGSAQAAQQAAAAMDKIAAPAAAAQAQIAKVAAAATAASGATDLLAKASAGGTISAAAMAKALEATGGNLAKITPEMLGMAEATAALAPASATAAAAMTDLGAAEVRAAGLGAGVTREFTVLGAEILRGNFSRIPGSLLVMNERLATTGTSVLTLKNVLGGVGALASVVLNPYILGFIAVTAGLDLATKAMFNFKGGSEAAAETLKQQKQLVEDLTAAYPALGKALKDALGQSSTGTPSQILVTSQRQIEDAQRRIASLSQDLNRQVADAFAPSFGVISGLALFPQLAEQVRALNDQFKAGTITATTFSDRLATLELNPDLPGIAKAVLDTFIKLTDQIAAAQTQASGFASTMDALKSSGGLIIGGDFAQLKSVSDLVDGLRKMAPDLRTPSQKAIDYYNQNSGLDNTGAGKNELDYVLGQIKLKQQQDAAKHARTGSPFQTSLDSLAKQTAALNAQANSYGLSTAQMESNVKAQELITQAQNAHLALSPKVLAAINAEASAYGAAAQAAKLAAVNDNANFALRTLGMNATDAGIAQTLKGAVGGDWPAYMNSSTAQTLRFAAAMSDLKQSAEDASNTFASTFLSDLKQGDTLMQSFADAASQALDQIANKLISMAMDNLWSNAFGGSSGGGGIFSFLGGLFGGGSALAPGAGLSWASAAFPAFASGTNSAPGGVALVGERGPELVRLPAGAQVRNAAQTAAMFNAAANSGTNDNGLTIHVNVDARGAQQGAGAEIATALTSFARNQLPTLIRQYNANPNRRGYVPYPAGA